jgi:hypothetical protein
MISNVAVICAGMLCHVVVLAARVPCFSEVTAPLFRLEQELMLHTASCATLLSWQKAHQSGCLDQAAWLWLETPAGTSST